MKVTRDQLHAQVWARPMLAVAGEYGVSASYLARVCAALNIPRPRRGYWAKVEAGHTPGRLDLSPARPGEQLEWTKGAGIPRQPGPSFSSAPLGRKPWRTVGERPSRHPLLTGARYLCPRL
jgi:hypothetical protein